MNNIDAAYMEAIYEGFEDKKKNDVIPLKITDATKMFNCYGKSV